MSRAQSAHAFIWLRLSNSDHPDVVAAGRVLNDLRTERNRADYQEKPAVTQATAITLVESAERAIAALDEAFQEPTRRRVAEAIKKYERDVLKEVTWRR